MAVKTNDKIYFDADCLSSFLRVGKENILIVLYGNKIVIPSMVVEELRGYQRRRSFPLYDKIIDMESKGLVSFESIKTGTDAYTIYDKLTNDNEIHNAIGKGESSVIALAVTNSNKMASNNLKDVTCWINYYRLNNITTADILVDAYKKSLLSQEEICEIWLKMTKVQKFNCETFNEYLEKVAM